MKKLFLLLFAFSIVTLLNAQPWLKNIPAEKLNNQTYNFYDIQKAFNQYWDGKEIERSKGWKQFKRWENFMEPRVYPTGNFPQNIMWTEYQKLKNTQTNKTITGDWAYIGATDVPTDINYGGNLGVGRVNCIAFHPTSPDTIWVGAPAGGFWKSTNGGQSWITTTDDLASIGVSAIAVNPNNTNEIYIATGDGDASDTYSVGILKSMDGGETWTSVLDISYESSYIFRKLLINPQNPQIMIAASNSGILRTTDGWDSYSTVQSGHFKDLEFKPGDPNIVYAAKFDYYGNSNIYKSTDGGENWNASSTGLSTGNINRIELAVTPASSNVVYALCSNASNSGFNGLYKSEDSGDSWTKIDMNLSRNLLGWDTGGNDSGGQGWYDLSLAVSPTNSDEIYVGGVNIWKTTNGGYNWSLNAHWYGGGGAEYVHADIHMLAFSPAGNLFAVNDGGVYKTTDGGENWNDISAGLQILQIYRIGNDANNPNIVLGGCQDNGTMMRNGTTWNGVIGGDGMDCLIDYENSDIMYGEYYYGAIQKSINGGSSFYNISPSGASGAWVTPYVIHPNNHNTLLAGYKDVYQTINGGQTWSTISSNLTGGSTINVVKYAPSNPNYIYVSSGTNVWRTTNSGDSWTNISSGLPGYYISDVEISSIDPDNIWVSLSTFVNGQKVYKSTNGGTNWTNYSDGLPNVPANCLEFFANSNDAIYLGTDLGVFFRNSNLDSWTPFNNGLPNVVIDELEIQYSVAKIRAATYGRGLWESDIYIDSAAAPSPNFIASATSITPGEAIDYRDLSFGTVTSWNWFFEGGTPETSTDASPAGIVYNEGGRFDVTFVVGNEFGTDTLVKENFISVITPLSVGFTSEIIEGDAPLEVAFADSSVGQINNWLWDFGDGTTSTEQNPVHIFQIPGTYSVSLTVSDDFNSLTETKTDYISVQSTLNADFTASPVSGNVPLTVSFGDNSTGEITSWDWNFGDDSTSNIQNPTHIYQEEGWFTVELTVSNGIYGETKTKTDYIGIWALNSEELNENDFVSIYPNPAKGIFNIIFSNSHDNVELKVYNLEGKCILNQFANNNAIQKIDLTSQPRGMYFIKIATENKIIVSKLLNE
ncbi:MAG: PKD domain-containing protein [Chlorobi bacterium]|nr:PKD domain-containing protein [Chlorobiota bacterium]